MNVSILVSDVFETQPKEKGLEWLTTNSASVLASIMSVEFVFSLDLEAAMMLLKGRENGR